MTVYYVKTKYETFCFVSASRAFIDEIFGAKIIIPIPGEDIVLAYFGGYGIHGIDLYTGKIRYYWNMGDVEDDQHIDLVRDKMIASIFNKTYVDYAEPDY